MNNHDELHLMAVSHTEMLRPFFDALTKNCGAAPPAIHKLVEEAWQLQLESERLAAEAAQRGFDLGSPADEAIRDLVGQMRAKIEEAKRLIREDRLGK